MSWIYESLSRAEKERPRADEGTYAPVFGQPAESFRAGIESISVSGSNSHSKPPLFCSDPQENFTQWMQGCFPGVVISRDDAIRRWLTRPLDTRILNNCDSPVENGRPENHVGTSSTCDLSVTRVVGVNSKPSAPKGDNRFLFRFALTRRALSKFFMRLVKCSVVSI